MKNKLTLSIIAAMVLGIGVGYLVYANASLDFKTEFAKSIKLLGTVFIRLVKTIIAPLVFSTLVVGIAKLGDLKTVGRIGGKAMLWFISASLVSLLLGMLLVNFFHPGTYIQKDLADNGALRDLMGNTSQFTLQKFVEHVVPSSAFEAMATNEILQIVVFSIFFWYCSGKFRRICKACY
jgi:Na+/H+-dicarboxylate symporter